MADPLRFHSLTLEGFRAYLQPQTFDFSSKPCLAIFAPNGKGKSSVIDALEFLFSEQGTLGRLGLRQLNNQGGISALAHNDAEGAGIVPVVKFATVSGKTVTEGSRAASGAQRPIHVAASAMKSCFVADPIIRGYTLRTFVEDQMPEARYTAVAGWLKLGPLVEVQKNLRALRREVKAATESPLEKTRLNGLLRTETGQVLNVWDEAAVLQFVNLSIVAPLDDKLLFSVLAKGDAAYAEVVARADAEEKQVGLAGLKQLRGAMVALHLETPADEEGSVAKISGAIPDFEAALAALAAAKALEADEHDKASEIVFRAVWQEAELLFAEDVAAPADCPLCETPIADSKAGSVAVIREKLSAHREELKTYDEAKKALDAAEVIATQTHNRLVARLPALHDMLSDEDFAGLKADIFAYQLGIANWPGSEVPDAAALTALLAKAIAALDAQIAEIEANQGSHTWAKAKAHTDRLIALKGEVDLDASTTTELSSLNDALILQAKQISEAIRAKVQSLLDTLQTPMNAIYSEIQGENAKPIRLELPGEDETNQQRLQLVIDFAENRESVPPGGYLSDSQIHSVALALRLAAIKQFNASAPLIALDDVVTSYDADHRRAIGALLAKMFTDCQIILATHDERFFNHLKDQLSAKEWQFTRIVKLDPGYGPRFSEHRVSDEIIEARWEAGQSAANEMRQAEEEWLLGIARGFGVDIRIRSLERAYSYERAELASAIGSFLKGIKLSPADVAGVNNRFIASLIKGEVENFGSHFQEGPYGDGSIGDEKTRWAEFIAFRAQFECGTCKRTKFQRPFPLKQPVCAHDACQAQFTFSSPPAPAAAV